MQQLISRWARIAMALGIILMASQCAFAQFGASLQGTVEDTAGSVVSGATVTITNVNTQQKATQTTGDTGYYRFSELGAGTFNVDITAPGFKAASFTGINVVAETPRNLDAKLAAGAAAETVTVTAESVSALQTADASIGTTIDNQQLQRVPTFGRDPYELLRTAPGISGDGARSGNGQAVFLPNGGGPGGSNNGIAATENQVQITANGQPVGANNYLIDGVSVNSLGRGGAAVVTPNIEAVGSITVLSSSYSAEDGRNSGAQIKTVTQNGTNKFHGGGVFTYDEPGLNAFNKYGGPNGQLPIRVGNKARDYAASIGGPIFKDKLFFFLSFEGFTSLNNNFATQFVETQQFRDLVHADRPGSIADQIVNAPGGAPRIVQVLTQSCSDPINFGNPPPPAAPTVCQVVPGGLDIGSPLGTTGTYASFNVPNQIVAGGGLDGIPDIQFAQIVQPNRARAKQYNGRIDYHITDRDLLFGSVYVTKLDTLSPSSTSGARPNDDVPFKPLNSAGALIYIHTFSPSLLNELRGNITRFAENGIKDAGTLVNFGIPFINIQNQQFNSNNDIQFGVAASSTTPAIFAENQYEIRDTVTKTWGAHTLRVGFEGRLEQDNNNLFGNVRPTYAFAGLWNFVNDAPIFESITRDPLTGGNANTARYLWDHYYAGFAQHDWKMKPNFTLNTGLRWEWFEPTYNKGQDINLPVFGPPGQELAGAILTPHNHYWKSDYKDFGPKLGFAWQPYPDGKTVVRGGFALAYNRVPQSLFDVTPEDGPGFFNFGFCCGTAPGDFGSPFANGQILYGLGASHSPLSYAPNPAAMTAINGNGVPANGVPIEVYGVNPNLKNPYSYLYSLEVQRELPAQIVFTLGYQGSTGRHFTRLVNQLFLFPSAAQGFTTPFTAAYLAESDSNSYYNAMNVHVSKRYRNGFSLDGTYTWSKSIDQISNGDAANASANQTTPQDNAEERGPSDFDIRSRVVVIGTYDFPKYNGGMSYLKPLVNGWQVNGNFTAHTGFPFTPVTFREGGQPTADTPQLIGPLRPGISAAQPVAYFGNYATTCSNSAFINGTAVTASQFNTNRPPDTPITQNPTPGIGRNTFRGPCYQSVDVSAAKQWALPFFGEGAYVRFQANAFNVFNKLNLTPFSNGNSNPASLIDSGSFGKAQSASAGRVVEFVARFQF